MIRQFIIGVLGVLALGAGPALAQESSANPPVCGAPDQFRYLTDGLPFMWQTLKRTGTLKVVAVGSASTLGVAPGSAYPARLARELEHRLPSAQVSVDVKAKAGATAQDMLKTFRSEVIPAKPALVIWQTGTVDANRSVNAESFADTLVTGIEALHKASIDVILMDMQYSPFTASMLNLELYRKIMIWVAQRRDVFLFRRYDLMHYWSENQIFDLSVTDRAEQKQLAERIHGCIGDMLAEALLSYKDIAREPTK
jgi:hypothetical protein